MLRYPIIDFAFLRGTHYNSQYSFFRNCSPPDLGPTSREGKTRRIPTFNGLWVSCKSDDRRTTLRVQDFNVSGALLVTEEAMPVGTRLELLFSDVEFVGMDARAFDLILKLVKRLLS
jgi:hypothetical protein